MLFIFRHGPCDESGYLTADGQKLIKSRGRTLLERYALDLEKTIVISSRELRALKTAQCFNAVLKIDSCLCHQELFSNDKVCDAPAALDIVKKYGEDFENVVVVTHAEMTLELSRLFCQSVGINGAYRSDISYGQGFAIDCKEKTCEFIE